MRERGEPILYRVVPGLLTVVASSEQPTAVRLRTAEILGQIGDRRAILPLKDLLSGSADAPEPSRTAARALGAIGDPWALLSLLALLCAKDPALAPLLPASRPWWRRWSRQPGQKG